MPQIAGAVGGLILVESFLVQFTLVNGDPAPGASTVLLGGILGLLFGALGGFLAWRLAGILKEGYRIEPGLTVPANRPLIVREGLS
jgi:H+/Cl- antiporter ClcA